MIRFYHATPLSFIAMGLAAMGLIACGGRPPPQSPGPPPTAAPHENLSRIVERYWDESGRLDPFYPAPGVAARHGNVLGGAVAPQTLADSLALERRYLALLLAMPRGSFDAESSLTYDIFLRERALAIESFTFAAELLPVNPVEGVPQTFALMASGAAQYPLSSAQDYDDWQVQTDAYVRWTAQAIANMREGMRRGYTLPRALVEKTLPLLAVLGEDTAANIFYQPIRSIPKTVGATERTRITAALTTAVREKILPAYRALHDFLQREYLPRSRTSVGLSALPLGEAWYAYLIKREIGVSTAPNALHAAGIAEVERVHARIQALLGETSFAGNAQSFLEVMRRDPRFSYRSADDLLNAYQGLKLQASAAAPALFSAAPQADFEIRAVETFREAAAPTLSYARAPESGRSSAVLYVNTGGLAARPDTAAAARFLREALPGHHYQLELQQERADLPRFRRYGGAAAFVEGWGLYAASLGEDLGLYRDPETRFGALIARLDCAAALVVDTGLHAQDWTSQQALDYLRAQTFLDDAGADAVVERVMALPGRALACTVGELKFQGLRARAQQTLGSRFDLRAFHTELLKEGAVPLDILEARIARWMEATAKLD
jgi:uncharacterized protein (DUF885 family)